MKCWLEARTFSPLLGAQNEPAPQLRGCPLQGDEPIYWDLKVTICITQAPLGLTGAVAL